MITQITDVKVICAINFNENSFSEDKFSQTGDVED